MKAEESLNFSSALSEYIMMALKIWPGLKISLANISSARSPPEGSSIPNRNYRDLSSEQFIEQIGKDLHNYILDHDVKSEHLQDYFDDILSILNTEQENFNTIRYMANQLAALIQELPENKFERLEKFRDIYNEVQFNSGAVVHQKQGDDSEDEGDEEDGSYDDGEEEEEAEGEGEGEMESEKNEPQPPQLISQQQQKDLEDDGWVVVKKKKK